MKLSCPKDSSHKQFSASAHEVRGWIVDETGNYIKDDGQGCEKIVVGPDFYGSVCMVEDADGNVCGADTEVSDM